VVTDIAPDSPAAEAITPGDVIVEVNRKAVESAGDYRRAMKSLKKGDIALVRIVSRQGARYQTFRIR
jgi:S1-C subfamily serine protease